MRNKYNLYSRNDINNLVRHNILDKDNSNLPNDVNTSHGIHALDMHLVWTISSFLPDNRSSINLAISCKEFYIFFRENGYLKTVTANVHTDMDVFIRNCRLHKRMVRRIVMHNIWNPHHWLPYRTDEVYFFQCRFSEDFRKINAVSSNVFVYLWSHTRTFANIELKRLNSCCSTIWYVGSIFSICCGSSC